MAFDVTQITAALDKYNGIHRPSHFLVRITPPSYMGEGSAEYNKDIEFLCDSTVLPGMHIDATPIRPLGYGVIENRPTEYVPGAVRLDFFVDNKGEALKYFQKWMGNIVNFSADVQKSSDGTNLNYYEFAYPKEYEGVLQIYVYDPSGAQITIYTLNRAWPANMGDVTLGWEMNDQISKLNVNFAYTSWSSQNLPFNSPQVPVGLNFPSLNNRLQATAPEALIPQVLKGLGIKTD